MLYGLTLPEGGPLARPESIKRIAVRAEELGFYAMEMGDHIVIPESIRSTYPYTQDGKVPDWQGWNEQVSTLSFLAGMTSRIRVVTAVLVLPYRSPVLASKMLATIDSLSGGRLIAGMGVGWMKEEFEALDAPPFNERGRVADEYIKLFKAMWTADTPAFHGDYADIGAVKFLPRPAQRPYPPIWVGGESPAAMRRAATEGDAWYPIGSNPTYPLRTLAQLRAAVGRLRAVSKQVGRKRTLGVSFVSPRFEVRDNDVPELFVGTAKKIASEIRECEKIGVSYVSFDLSAGTLEETLSRMKSFSKDMIRRG